MTDTPSLVDDPSLLQRVLAGLGIDRAVGWTVAARVWSVLAGPISVILIATRLSGEEQGFYYTFASVASFQAIFELGLGLVILQFASHERAFLQWQPDGTLDGSAVEKGRLASLLRKTLQWYAVATALTLVSLLIGGTIFFAMKPTTVSWQYPWIALAFFVAGSLFLTPLLSVLEGCGLVVEVARVRMWQAIAGNLVAWTVLLTGGRVWASPAISGAALIVVTSWLFLTHRHFFSDLLRAPGEGISWRKEVWPFQWRVGVSWISSYFIFHLFIPVLFSSRGPVAAGQMGMSLSLVTAVFSVATALITTKVPLFGELIARRDFAELDACFFPAMWRSLGAMTLGGALLFGGATFLHAIGHRWSARFLEPLPFALLLGAFLANTVFFAEAVYLRAHKQEPLLGIFIGSAITISSCTFILGHRFGATGMMAGYFVSTLLVSLGGGTVVFQRKRREWHGLV